MWNSIKLLEIIHSNILSFLFFHSSNIARCLSLIFKHLYDDLQIFLIFFCFILMNTLLTMINIKRWNIWTWKNLLNLRWWLKKVMCISYIILNSILNSIYSLFYWFFKWILVYWFFMHYRHCTKYIFLSLFLFSNWYWFCIFLYCFS